MMTRLRLLALLLPWLTLLGGCERDTSPPSGSPPEETTPPSTTPPGETPTPPPVTEVTVGVAPEAVTLETGGTQRFVATVTGTSDTAVAWSATGGEVSSEGVYTAPAVAGTYTVRAVAHADASRSATATVTVVAPPPPPPTLAHFEASPASITAGEGTTLSWEVTGATQLDLEPEPGQVTGASVVVHPASTRTYTLTATNASGSVTASTQVTVKPPPDTWAGLSTSHEQPGNYDSDVYRWLDEGRQQRTAVLTRNTGPDPGGSYGGMLRQFRFSLGSTERVTTGTGASGLWNGWGYVVSHYGSTVAYTANVAGTWRQVFVGRYHALHEFSWNLPINGLPVKVTVQWFFATGKDHPVYAVTFDTSAAGSDGLGVSADSRTPYGDVAWDGDGTQAWVDGVKWGDKYRFFTRDEPLTPQSRWDYSQPNTVPYASTYSRAADAEMGMVQTLTWSQHNTGGTWFSDNWGHTSEDRANADEFGSWRMPPNWNWPYQLCQYELFSDTQPTQSKRLAWGLMYGAVGSPAYYGYGYESQLPGHPYQSYSVYMVMGRQSVDPVVAQATQVEHQVGARLSATRGTVVTAGPGGVGRSDSVSYAVPGYNSLYGVYELRADSAGGFSVSLDAAGGELHNPLFLVHTSQGLPAHLWLDGTALVADVDYFASDDAASGQVWLTLKGSWSGSHTLSTVSDALK